MAGEKGAARGSRPTGGRACTGGDRRREERCARGGGVTDHAREERSPTMATCVGGGVGHRARELDGVDEAVAAGGLPAPLPGAVFATDLLCRPAGRPHSNPPVACFGRRPPVPLNRPKRERRGKLQSAGAATAAATRRLERAPCIRRKNDERINHEGGR
uniref:Uncharacterized protein n=1 Tax=Oryza sativa subsp. japonica TaxID=39947 RepID=Q6Z963_ORYSJ|nr:hypothetical protein [Oryza sativa Japonica Group]BAD09956.1 hypothetical protein [Oryza sativa Japonica Group]